MKKAIIIVAIILGLIILYGIYYYPYQYCMAKRSYQEYIKKQGIDLGLIESLDIRKDYKTGGYNLVAHYLDDDKCEYRYYYYPSYGAKETHFNYILCLVFIEENLGSGNFNTGIIAETKLEDLKETGYPGKELPTVKHPPIDW